MKAIVTKYIPATNTKPSRIKAKAEGVPAVTLCYNSYDNPHREAALTLCRKYGWGENIIGGGMPDQSGEVFVFADRLVKAIAAMQNAVDPLLVAIGGVSGVEPQRRAVIEAQRNADLVVAEVAK